MPRTRLTAPQTRTKSRTKLRSGLPVILVGFLCYAASSAFEGGFLRGLCQGATIAMMVSGAYLVGAGLWFSRKDDEDLRNGGHWLPSRDGRGDGTR